MPKKRKPAGYWTFERCYNEALKYNSRSDLSKNSPTVYKLSRERNWLNIICKHIVQTRKLPGYWTFEKSFKEALKYKTREEFKKGSPSAYSASRKNNWFKSYQHLPSGGNRFKRGIYAFEFSDNCAYIGLTYNFERRKKEHITFGSTKYKSPVYKHIKKYKIKPNFKKLHTYTTIEKAIKLESYYIDTYKRNGWILLNSIKSGGLGGIITKWTKEKCKEEALKYTARKKFDVGSHSAYCSARKHKWLNDVCSHMKQIVKPVGYWTFKNCKKEALKYKTRAEFGKYSSGAYNKAINNKWLEKICSHMIRINKPQGYWTFKNCKKEALKYKTRAEFIYNSKSAYTAAQRHGWLKNVCTHMIYINKTKPHYYWTYEKCKKEALKYKTRAEFKRNSGGAYYRSNNNNWLDRLCMHMIELRKPKNYWTKEQCKKEALKYTTRIAFNKNSPSAYNTAIKNIWIDTICSHMILQIKPKRYWTYKKCKETAIAYTTKRDFKKDFPGVYSKAAQHNWLKDICQHMPRRAQRNRAA
jgi:hypothetical protein